MIPAGMSGVWLPKVRSIHGLTKGGVLQESPVRVSKCPQAAILRCTSAAHPALLLSAQGLDVHVWRLGSALDRQHQVGDFAVSGTSQVQ